MKKTKQKFQSPGSIEPGLEISKIWFTLVELIVVISILAVISTIWFISYSSYLAWVRDTNRITQLDELQRVLEIYRSKNVLPYPDDRINIMSWTTNIWYQWYVWANVLSSLQFTKWWKDPKDKTYFSYYLSNSRNKFQLMAFLEKNESLVVFDNNILPNTYAATINYSKRIASVIWNEIGILTDTSNTPIQEIPSLVASGQIDLAWANSGTLYLSHLTNTDILNDYGNKIRYSLLTKSSDIYEWPKGCWIWYIPVPGNAAFNQKWFCVAKYEMSYDDWTWTLNSGWNTYSYTWSKYITPRNDYPIANLTQWEAITACSDIGDGYHLITDNEWKTIARNVELESKNWSSWIVWNWYLYAWNTGDTWNTIWCSDSTWQNASWTKTWWNDKIWLSSTRTTCSEKRQLLLSDGEIIWDFAWNVSEHVNKANTIDGTSYGSGQTSVLWCNPTTWYAEWTSCTGWAPWNNLSYNSNFWIWKINTSAWVASNVFVRSWKFWDTVNAWLYNLELQHDNTYKAPSLWFRCAK